jgi:hypothetical protein
MNITYLNNNINNNILSETNLNNINSKLNSSSSNIRINLKKKNNDFYNNINSNNNNFKLNQTFTAKIQNQVDNFKSSSFSPNKEDISNSFRENYIKNEINPINEELVENENSIYQLSNDILNKFSPLCITKYNIIINFLKSESKNIHEQLDIYNRKNNSKNKLDILLESGEFSRYNNILNQIYKEENNKSNKYYRYITSKSKIFEMIKKNCEENFNFIQKYSDRNNIVISKLNQLINQIEDYNIQYSDKNNFNNNNVLIKNNNIENIFNSTVNIDSKENKLYNNNFNDNNFINTIHSSNNYNNYWQNLSHI